MNRRTREAAPVPERVLGSKLSHESLTSDCEGARTACRRRGRGGRGNSGGACLFVCFARICACACVRVRARVRVRGFVVLVCAWLFVSRCMSSRQGLAEAAAAAAARARSQHIFSTTSTFSVFTFSVLPVAAGIQALRACWRSARRRCAGDAFSGAGGIQVCWRSARRPAHFRWPSVFRSAGPAGDRRAGVAPAGRTWRGRCRR